MFEKELSFIPKELTRARKLDITEFPYSELNNDGKVIYLEYENGYWAKWNYYDGLTHMVTSLGDWEKTFIVGTNDISVNPRGISINNGGRINGTEEDVHRIIDILNL